MEAKDLVKIVDVKGEKCLVLTAYPYYGVNEKTGEMITLETNAPKSSTAKPTK